MDSIISDFIKICDNCQKNQTNIHLKPDTIANLYLS